MASRAFRGRAFLAHRLIGQCVVSKVEKSPAISLRKTLAVFHGHIHAVKLAFAKTAARRRIRGTVGKCTLAQQNQLLDDYSAFREYAVLLIGP